MSPLDAVAAELRRARAPFQRRGGHLLCMGYKVTTHTDGIAVEHHCDGKCGCVTPGSRRHLLEDPQSVVLFLRMVGNNRA